LEEIMSNGKETTIQAILAETGLFGGLSEKHRRALVAVARLQSLKKRDVLFAEETRADTIYTLARGGIQLTKNTADGREIVIRTVRPGGTFGEVVLFEAARYPVTATAVSPSEVVGLPCAHIHSLLDDASFRDDFIALLMKRQRYLAERVRYLTSYDVEERLLRFLAEHYGQHEKIELTLSKKDIAAAIGATPETLSRLILRLKEDGLLEWEGKTVRLAAGIWAERDYHFS